MGETKSAPGYKLSAGPLVGLVIVLFGLYLAVFNMKAVFQLDRWLADGNTAQLLEVVKADTANTPARVAARNLLKDAYYRYLPDMFFLVGICMTGWGLGIVQLTLNKKR